MRSTGCEILLGSICSGAPLPIVGGPGSPWGERSSPAALGQFCSRTHFEEISSFAAFRHLAVHMLGDLLHGFAVCWETLRL